LCFDRVARRCYHLLNSFAHDGCCCAQLTFPYVMHNRHTVGVRAKSESVHAGGGT